MEPRDPFIDARKPRVFSGVPVFVTRGADFFLSTVVYPVL